MTDRTMVKVSATENCLVFRTITKKRKSPRSFYVLRDDVKRLEQHGSVTANDIHCFAELRRDVAYDLVQIRFFWLRQMGANRLEGHTEMERLPYGELMNYERVSRQNPGAAEWKVLSVDNVPMPRMVFRSTENLHAALSHRTVRRKLVRSLRDDFQWPWSEEIRFYNDSLPYSFFFREIRGGRPSICGGLILHGQENIDKAYYSIHT